MLASTKQKKTKIQWKTTTRRTRKQWKNLEGDVVKLQNGDRDSMIRNEDCQYL